MKTAVETIFARKQRLCGAPAGMSVNPENPAPAGLKTGSASKSS
jgi:hypothetical protein